MSPKGWLFFCHILGWLFPVHYKKGYEQLKIVKESGKKWHDLFGFFWKKNQRILFFLFGWGWEQFVKVFFGGAKNFLWDVWWHSLTRVQAHGVPLCSIWGITVRVTIAFGLHSKMRQMVVHFPLIDGSRPPATKFWSRLGIASHSFRTLL